MSGTEKVFRIFLAGIALVALGALLIGCGDSDEETATASAPLTKAALLKQGNAVCRKAGETRDSDLEAALKQEGGRLLSLSPQEGEDLVVEVILPVYQDAVSRLQSLTPPAKDEQAFSRLVAEFEESLEELEANPAKAVTRSPFAKAGEEAEDYGLAWCVF